MQVLFGSKHEKGWVSGIKMISEDIIFKQHVLDSIHDSTYPIGQLAKSDPEIIIFGKYLLRGHTQKKSLVTNTMRLMARILLNAREVGSDDTLDFEAMLISPYRWDTLERGSKQVIICTP